MNTTATKTEFSDGTQSLPDLETEIAALKREFEGNRQASRLEFDALAAEAANIRETVLSLSEKIAQLIASHEREQALWHEARQKIQQADLDRRTAELRDALAKQTALRQATESALEQSRRTHEAFVAKNRIQPARTEEFQPAPQPDDLNRDREEFLARARYGAELLELRRRCDLLQQQLNSSLALRAARKMGWILKPLRRMLVKD